MKHWNENTLHSNPNKKSKAVAKSHQAANKKGKKKQSRKNQIRNLTRLLQKKTLPDATRKEIEKKIHNLQSQITESKAQERVNKMQEKYKKVKFFEKVKVTRKLGQIQKKLDKCEDEAARELLQKEKKQLEDDLKYIEFYPPDQKYIGLYANTDDDPKTLKRKAKMRELALQGAENAEKNSMMSQAVTKVEASSINEEVFNEASDDFFLS